MIARSQKYIYFLMGAVILFPAFYLFASHDIFYLQIFAMSIFLVLYILLPRHKKHPLNLLDQVVIVYVIWIFISSILNAIFTLDPEQNLHRVLSLFVCLGYMSPYFISRNYFRDPNYLKYFFWGIIGIYSIFFIYTIFRFLNFGTKDLMSARVILGQRLPLIVCFITTLAMYYIFSSGKKNRNYLYFFCLTGIILVALSLTRACYFQLFIGFLFIFFTILKRKKKSSIKKLFFVIALFIIGLFLLSSLNLFNIATVMHRLGSTLDLSLIHQDSSFADRTTMWAGLLNSLIKQPLRIIFGYGQLGPSYVGPSVISAVTGGIIQLYSAHNEYLDILIRNGIIGLLIFLGIWVMVIYKGFFPDQGIPEDSKNFFIGHSIALLGVLGYGLFHETVRYPIFGMYFWFYLGIVSAVLYSKKEVLSEKNNSKKDDFCKI